MREREEGHKGGGDGLVIIFLSDCVCDVCLLATLMSRQKGRVTWMEETC